MSLDLYLKTKSPVKKCGTGVFVNKEGKPVELKTLEEVREYLPDFDISDIVEYVTETDTMWKGNITHNLAEMALHIVSGKYNMYQLIWIPNEIGFEYLTETYRNSVFKGLVDMLNHRGYLETYNPSNGWGDYDSLLTFIHSYCDALSRWDGKEEIIIYAS